jgi:tetrahydromethanopterin S-methyltransferase subunit C
LHERPVGELLKQLANETTTLVRQELELAKAEMRDKAGKAGLGFGMWGAAGVTALLAAGALTAFLILALDGAMPNWLAALIVGLVYAAIAGVLYLLGKRRVQEAGSPVPEQTIETVKEDVQWAKHPTTSAKT